MTDGGAPPARHDLADLAPDDWGAAGRALADLGAAVGVELRGARALFRALGTHASP